MSTHVLTGDLPERDHSTDRFWGFMASVLPATVELMPEQQPTSMLTAVERPDWWTDGTLPGVMAGKRPAR